MSKLTTSFTLQMTPAMRDSLDRRAATDERPTGFVVRQAIAAFLAIEDDADEELTDRTPELPLA